MFSSYKLSAFLILSLLLLDHPAAAEEAASRLLYLTLPQALRLAKDEHVQVIMANERIQQALARIRETVSFLFPQLSTGISEKRQTKDIRAIGIPLIPGAPTLVGPFNTFDARVKITQSILDVSALERLKAAHDDHEVSIAELRKTKQDVLALVASLFIEAKRAEQSMQVAHTLLKRDKSLLHLSYLRLQSGQGTPLENLEGKSQYLESFSKLRSAYTRFHQRKLDVCAALGLSENQAIVFAVSNQTQNLFKIPSQKNIKTAFADQPDIDVVRKQLKELQTHRSQERSEYFPKISLSADYGPSGEAVDDYDDTYTFGVQATMPIFEGGLRFFRVREVDSQIREIQVHLKDVERQTRFKLLNSIESINEVTTILKTIEAELAIVDQKYDLALSRLKMGTGSQVELINLSAQRTVVNDQKDEAVSSYVLAQVELAHALGAMEELAKGEK